MEADLPPESGGRPGERWDVHEDEDSWDGHLLLPLLPHLIHTLLPPYIVS